MPFDDTGSWSPRPLRVGVTGHRRLDASMVGDVRAACRELLASLGVAGRLDGGGVEAFSALAIGADTIFAHAALELDIPLVGLLPFRDYPRDFTGEERTTFDELVASCAEIVRLDHTRRTNRAYMAVGEAILDRVDLLVAVWDGAPAHGTGGTGDVVALAEDRGMRVIRIPVARDRPSAT